MKPYTLMFAFVASSGLASVSTAQTPTYKRDVPDSLARATKVTETAALAAAQAKVPKGKVRALELERENGKLIYSFEFKVAGKTGIDEVNVDALTGKTSAPSHESPATEKKEAAEEKKAAKPKKP
jgi:uncharacterized membrane protein YkoI